jgi:WD40 repeat protein
LWQTLQMPDAKSHHMSLSKSHAAGNDCLSWVRPALLCLLLLGSSGPAYAEEAETKANETSLGIPIAQQKRVSAVDFEKEVLPILKQNCLACHNRTKAKGELTLETPADILKGGDSGPAVVPGRSEESLLLRLAAHQAKPRMPPRDNKVAASDLTPDELGLLKLWIDQGAKGEVHGSGPIVWQELPAGLNPIYAVAITPDGQFAACGRANQIWIYHLPSRQLVTRLTDPQLTRAGLSHSPGIAQRDLVHALSFNRNGTMLASGDYRAAKLWRRAEDLSTFRSQVPEKDASLTVLSHDGQWLVTASKAGIRLWNPRTGLLLKERVTPIVSLRTLCLSPDSTRLVAVGEPDKISIWTLPSLELLVETNLTAQINAVCWLPTNRMATGGADGMLRVWHLPSIDAGGLTQISELPGNTNPITALVGFDGWTNQILSASADGSVRRWDLETGQAAPWLDHGTRITVLAVRPDGKRVLTAGLDPRVKLWDATNGKLIGELKGDRYRQELVAHRQRALTLAQSEVNYRTSAVEQAEKEWKTETENLKKAQETKTSAQKKFEDKSKAKKTADEAKAKAETSLAAVRKELKEANDALKTLEQADKLGKKEMESAIENLDHAKITRAKILQTQNLFEKLQGQLHPSAHEHPEEKQSLSTLFSEIELSVGQLNAELGSNGAIASALAERLATNALANLEIISKNRSVASKFVEELSDREKKATERTKSASKTAETAEKEYKQAEIAKSVAEDQVELSEAALEKAAAAIPIARSVLQNAQDKTGKAEVDLVEAQKAEAESEKPVRAVSFSPDNLTVATASEDGLIRTWSAESGVAFEVYQGYSTNITGLVFLSRDELISSAEDGMAIGWRLLPEWSLARVVGTGDEGSSVIDRVTALAFSSDGQWLATGSGDPSRSGEIKIWDARTGQLVKEFNNPHTDSVLCLAFSPDGKFLASGSADRFLRVFDAITASPVRSFEGHTHHVLGISWKADGRMLASAGADNVVKLWDFAAGSQKKTIEGFSKEVTSVQYLEAQDALVAASGDRQVRQLGEDGKTLRNFSGATSFVQSLAVTPDGKTIVGGTQEGVLLVWNGLTGEINSTFPPPDQVGGGVAIAGPQKP